MLNFTRLLPHPLAFIALGKKYSPVHSSSPRGPGGASDPILKAKVLIVEDDPLVSAAMGEMFRIRLDCEVDVATNGLTAFECLEHNRYSLVISDLRMPEMTGTELYLWLCEAQPKMATRFIFVTGYPEDRHFEVALKQWGVPVIAKPCKLSDLAAACGPYLSPH